jgi:hypothetical protein
MMNRTALSLVILALLASTNVSCASASPEEHTLEEADYPWELLPSDSLGKDLFWRQRISASFQDREESFQAVVQSSNGVLLVVGLSPMGTKSFILRQEGLDSTFEEFVDGEFPFPGRFILIDLQRCFFPLGSTDTIHSGVNLFQFNGETVEETWRDGQLVTRRFQRPGYGEHGEAIVVSYEDWSEDGSTAKKVTLENGWFEYRLIILNSSD